MTAPACYRTVDGRVTVRPDTVSPDVIVQHYVWLDGAWQAGLYLVVSRDLLDALLWLLGVERDTDGTLREDVIGAQVSGSGLAGRDAGQSSPLKYDSKPSCRQFDIGPSGPTGRGVWEPSPSSGRPTPGHSF